MIWHDGEYFAAHGLRLVDRSDYDWLCQQYFSPLFGMRQIAASLVADWGYEPGGHPALMGELEAAVSEAFVDTAYEVMREHGLRGPADPLPDDVERAVRAQLGEK